MLMQQYSNNSKCQKKKKNANQMTAPFNRYSKMSVTSIRKKSELNIELKSAYLQIFLLLLRHPNITLFK